MSGQIAVPRMPLGVAYRLLHSWADALRTQQQELTRDQMFSRKLKAKPGATWDEVSPLLRLGEFVEHRPGEGWIATRGGRLVDASPRARRTHAAIVQALKVLDHAVFSLDEQARALGCSNPEEFDRLSVPTSEIAALLNMLAQLRLRVDVPA